MANKTATEIALQQAATQSRLNALAAVINQQVDNDIMRMLVGKEQIMNTADGQQMPPVELPPFPPLPPTASDEDRAARDRQERFEKLGIPAAPDMMTEEAYKRMYGARWHYVTPYVMDQVERTLRVLHCHKCREVDSRNIIKASRLFVTIEDDPMQQFPALAHSTCHHCGFEEYYPLRKDPRRELGRIRQQELQKKYELELKQEYEAYKKQAPQPPSMIAGQAKGLPSQDNTLSVIAEALRRKGIV